MLYLLLRFFSVYAIKYPYLVNLSIITSIMLYTYPITRSFNFSNFIIKSYNITSYSLLSIFTSYSSLYSLYLLNLLLYIGKISSPANGLNCWQLRQLARNWRAVEGIDQLDQLAYVVFF